VTAEIKNNTAGVMANRLRNAFDRFYQFFDQHTSNFGNIQCLNKSAEFGKTTNRAIILLDILVPDSLCLSLRSFASNCGDTA